MKIKIFVLSIATILMVTSCEKLIDIDQPDIIEQDQAFSDKNSIRLSMIGLYGLMTDLVEPLFLAGEVRADLVVANKSAESYIKEYSNNNISASNPYISPKPFYTIINNVNDFIFEFESLLAEQKMDTADFMCYKSELVGIRVWCQYQIAKIYGKCKYYTYPLNSNENNDIEELVFGEKLFNQLISDLAFSDTNNFTSQNEDIIWQSIRFSDFYINALMGELYMDLGEYLNAYNKFNEIIIDGDEINMIYDMTYRFNIYNALEEDLWIEELFVNEWENSRLIENSLFMIAFNNKYNQTNELWNWTSSLNYQVAPATWYIDKFWDHAYSNEDYIDYRYKSVLNRNSAIERTYSISKYLEDDRPFIMMRTARIFLLKAFCKNALDEKTDALKDIERVRVRINYPKIDENKMPEDEAEAKIWIEDLIIDELAYETGFEGQRWFDLMRVAIRRNDPSYLANTIAQKFPEESREKIRTKLMDKSNWFIPIFE